MVGCVLGQLKPLGFSILSCEKGLDLRPRAFFTAKNVELLGLYPIQHGLTRSVSLSVGLRKKRSTDLYDITPEFFFPIHV